MYPEDIRRRTYSDGELEFDHELYGSGLQVMVEMCMDAVNRLEERQATLCAILDVAASSLEEQVVSEGLRLPALDLFDFEID